MQKLTVHQNSLWISFQSQFKATASQHKQLCSCATYLHFVNLSSLFWLCPISSLSCLLFAFLGHGDISLSFPLPHSVAPLENRDTDWRSRCIKSICRLNLLQSEAWIRSAFSCSCCYSESLACVCLHRRPVRLDGPNYS